LQCKLDPWCYGFSENVLASLRARPEVSKVEHHGNRLLIELGSAADMAPLVSLVVSASAQVEEIYRGNTSLEEVFMTLMGEEN